MDDGLHRHLFFLENHSQMDTSSAITSFNPRVRANPYPTVGFAECVYHVLFCLFSANLAVCYHFILSFFYSTVKVLVLDDVFSCREPCGVSVSTGGSRTQALNNQGVVKIHIGVYPKHI